jgi:hypothetical protein
MLRMTKHVFSRESHEKARRFTARRRNPVNDALASLAQSAGCEACVCGDLSASYHAKQQRDEENHEENKEQNLGDGSRTGCDAAEAKHSRDNRDDKENDSVLKHDVLLSPVLSGSRVVAAPRRRVRPLDARHLDDSERICVASVHVRT